MKNFSKKFAPAVVCATLALSACKKPESEVYSEKVPPIEQVQEGTQEKITNIVSEAMETSEKKKEEMVNVVSKALDQSGKDLEETLKKIEEEPVVTQITQTKDAWQNIVINPTDTASSGTEGDQEENSTIIPEDTQKQK